MLAVAFLYLCFTATMFLGSLILTTNKYPFFIAGARFFMSGVILLSLYVTHHKHVVLKQLPELLCVSFFKYAFCLYTVSALGFSWGMQYVDPVKACFVFILAPFITALLLYFLYDEKLTLKKIIGLGIGFLAVLPILIESGHDHVDHSSWQLAMFGYIVFAAAVVTFSYGWILNKEMHKIIHVPSALITGAALLIGGGTTLLFFLLFQGHRISSMQVTPDFWWLLLLFSILTSVAYNLYAQLLKRYSPTFISFASFLEPAFGLLYASVFLGKPISSYSLVALASLGFGLYLFYQEELRLE